MATYSKNIVALFEYTNLKSQPVREVSLYDGPHDLFGFDQTSKADPNSTKAKQQKPNKIK